MMDPDKQFAKQKKNVKSVARMSTRPSSYSEKEAVIFYAKCQNLSQKILFTETKQF